MKYWRWTVALALILTVAVSILAKQNGQNPPQSKDAENRIVEMLQEARKIKGEGDYSGAQALLERALTEAEKSLGPNHSMIAVLLNDLAEFYYKKADYGRAEQALQRAISIAEKDLSPDDPVLVSLRTYLHQVQHAKERAAKSPPPKTPNGQGSASDAEIKEVLRQINQRSQQAEKLRQEGKLAEAIAIAEEALSIAEKSLGPEHLFVGTTLHLLSVLYVDSGDTEQAIKVSERALAIIEKVKGPEHENTAFMVSELGIIYLRQHNYVKAEPLLQRSLSIYEKVYGPNHPDVALSLMYLGDLYNETGDYARAEQSYQHGIVVLEKTVGPDQPDVALILSKLGSVFYSRGDYAQAEPFLQRALTIEEKAEGPDSPTVAQSLNNLAELYRTIGDYAKAEPLYERAVAIVEKARGPNHPDVAIPVQNLGILYLTKGDYARAEPLLQRALAINEKSFGPTHPSLALTLNNLGELYRTIGDYGRAMTLNQRALAIEEKTLRPETPLTAATLNNIALTYAAQNDYEQAESFFKRSLEMRERIFGENHPDVAQSLNNLAEIYRQQGDYARCEPLLQRAIAICEKTLGPENPALATFINNLATIYLMKGDFKRAEPLLQRSLEIREKVLGPEHLDVADSLNNLANLYRQKGDYAKAQSHFKRAIGIIEKALGPEHPALLKILNNLAATYEMMLDPRAIETLERALTIEEKALGRERPEVANTLNSLAVVYVLTRDYTHASEFAEAALAIDEKVLGPEHPDVAVILSVLGMVYQRKGDYSRAEQAYQRSLAIREKLYGPRHPAIVTVLSNLWTFYDAKGDIPQAIRSATRAADIDEHNLELILNTGSEEQKRLYVSTLSFQAGTNALISLHFHSAPNNPDAARLALTTILRRKGRVLDVMSDQMGALRRRLNAQDQVLLDQLGSIRSQLASLVLKGPGNSDPAKHQAAIAKLESEAQGLEAEVSARSSEFRAQSQTVTLERVQHAIPANAVLVELTLCAPIDIKSSSISPARYVAYLLRREGEPSWVDLGEASAIDSDVAKFRDALREAKRGDVKQLARALDERVMRPIRTLLGDTRTVLLSPDGALNLVPFAALVDEQNHYLLENYSFIYLTSGRDLLRLETRIESKDGPIVIANPLFDSSPTSGSRSAQENNSQRSMDFTKARFTPLPGTAGEADALRSLWPTAKVLTAGGATESAVKRVNAPSILHIATHGFFLPDQPNSSEASGADRQLLMVSPGSPNTVASIENPLLRSGLALAGANPREGGDGEDGILTALEASGLDLWGTKLVVLSACETGIGEVKNGEGVYGLRRALALAGAESQVMSLWQVSDIGTRDLMVDFYKRLKAGEGRAEAFRHAQLDMLSDKNRSHPYYWASFIQSGAWTDLNGKR